MDAKLKIKMETGLAGGPIKVDYTNVTEIRIEIPGFEILTITPLEFKAIQVVSAQGPLYAARVDCDEMIIHTWKKD